MAVPTLTPKSRASRIVLTSTGSLTTAGNTTNYAFGLYADTSGPLYDKNFISGAVAQVAYTFKKLGGDVLDVELTVGNVYTAYEEAVMEYSYLLNVHQSKNILANALGNTTGSFDHFGQIRSGETLSGSNVSLKYPRFDFTYARRIADGVSSEAGVGGNVHEYSASFSASANVQDYDLQKILSASAASGETTNPWYGKIGNKKIIVKKVFYKTPQAMWRFYGYYGGLNVIGNLHAYGQWADDSTWEIIPPWQNKLQAQGFEDAIYTRNSHYAYEIKNNMLRIFPPATDVTPRKYWVQFTVASDIWDEDTDRTIGIEGVNNMNTLPFENIPYKNINAIGKQWVRRFALALSKEMLGQIRGKFSTVPIPGESVTLNHAELLSQAKEEQEKLREELKTVLDELRYSKLVEDDAALIEGTDKILHRMPMGIYVG
jgi:hypothetical protein